MRRHIYPPLDCDNADVYNGWKDGDIAFWTAGDDFVIFFDDEAISSSTGNIVTLGRVTDDIETVRALNNSIEVKIERKQ